MNLLTPVRNWIIRKPDGFPDWLDGLDITQADIDSALFHPDAEAESPAARPLSVAWMQEEVGA